MKVLQLDIGGARFSKFLNFLFCNRYKFKTSYIIIFVELYLECIFNDLKPKLCPSSSLNLVRKNQKQNQKIVIKFRVKTHHNFVSFVCQ